MLHEWSGQIRSFPLQDSDGKNEPRSFPCPTDPLSVKKERSDPDSAADRKKRTSHRLELFPAWIIRMLRHQYHRQNSSHSIRDGHPALPQRKTKEVFSDLSQPDSEAREQSVYPQQMYKTDLQGCYTMQQNLTNSWYLRIRWWKKSGFPE